MRATRFLETTSQNLRYAVRGMRKNPGFSIAVVLTVALGIGANVAIFSIVHAVLLKPLRYREPDRVVVIAGGATPVRFEELQASSKSYTEMGAFASGFENMSLSGVGEPEVLEGARVSSNFLHILEVNPLLGRSFRPEEDKSGAPPVAMISAELWHRRFGGDRAIIGRNVMLAGMPHTIIAVLPMGFSFPFSRTDVWVTRPAEWSVISAEGRSRSPILYVFGRLKPHLAIQQANAELAVFNRQYATAHPEMLGVRADSPDNVRPLKDEVVSTVRSELWMLFGAVGLVLLIVCANVASLLLARATSRAREFAVRAAIGAGRGRIIGQLLTESILLASAGGLVGIGLAAWSLSAIRRVTFIDLPRTGEIQLDGSVLGFALLLALVTGALFGLVPSLAASRPDLAGVLRGSGEARTASGSTPRLRFGPRGLLVVGQVALSIVLLISATLLIESLARVYRVDPGFQTSHLLTMSIALPPARYNTDDKKAAFYEQLIERTQGLPGVRSAAVTLTLPMTDTWMGSPLQLAEGPPVKFNERPIGVIQDISPEYFKTMAVALKRGRAFTAHDTARTPTVVIINENLARKFWPEYPGGVSPLGHRIVVGTNPPAEIVGIAPDVRYSGRDDNPMPGVYMPLAQKPPGSAMLAVRTEGNPLSFANAVRGQVLAIDPDQPVAAVASMDELVESSEGQLRLMMRLLGTFAGAALLLAVIGLYGVISYSVVQRTKEIGVRRALGAKRGDILSLMAGQVVKLALAGVLLGIGGAFAVTRLLQDLLFQVSATDPATFVAIPVLFVAVAMGASYIPARRASEIDPMAALRVG